MKLRRGRMSQSQDSECFNNSFLLETSNFMKHKPCEMLRGKENAKKRQLKHFKSLNKWHENSQENSSPDYSSQDEDCLLGFEKEELPTVESEELAKNHYAKVQNKSVVYLKWIKRRVNFHENGFPFNDKERNHFLSELKQLKKNVDVIEKKEIEVLQEKINRRRYRRKCIYSYQSEDFNNLYTELDKIAVDASNEVGSHVSSINEQSPDLFSSSSLEKENSTHFDDNIKDVDSNEITTNDELVQQLKRNEDKINDNVEEISTISSPKVKNELNLLDKRLSNVFFPSSSLEKQSNSSPHDKIKDDSNDITTNDEIMNTHQLRSIKEKTNNANIEEIDTFSLSGVNDELNVLDKESKKHIIQHLINIDDDIKRLDTIGKDVYLDTKPSYEKSTLEVNTHSISSFDTDLLTNNKFLSESCLQKNLKRSTEQEHERKLESNIKNINKCVSMVSSNNDSNIFVFTDNISTQYHINNESYAMPKEAIKKDFNCVDNIKCKNEIINKLYQTSDGASQDSPDIIEDSDRMSFVIGRKRFFTIPSLIIRADPMDIESNGFDNLNKSNEKMVSTNIEVKVHSVDVTQNIGNNIFTEQNGNKRLLEEIPLKNVKKVCDDLDCSEQLYSCDKNIDVVKRKKKYGNNKAVMGNANRTITQLNFTNVSLYPNNNFIDKTTQNIETNWFNKYFSKSGIQKSYEVGAKESASSSKCSEEGYKVEKSILNSKQNILKHHKDETETMEMLSDYNITDETTSLDMFTQMKDKIENNLEIKTENSLNTTNLKNVISNRSTNIDDFFKSSNSYIENENVIDIIARHRENKERHFEMDKNQKRNEMQYINDVPSWNELGKEEIKGLHINKNRYDKILIEHCNKYSNNDVTDTFIFKDVDELSLSDATSRLCDDLANLSLPDKNTAMSDASSIDFLNDDSPKSQLEVMEDNDRKDLMHMLDTKIRKFESANVLNDSFFDLVDEFTKLANDSGARIINSLMMKTEKKGDKRNKKAEINPFFYDGTLELSEDVEGGGNHVMSNDDFTDEMLNLNSALAKEVEKYPHILDQKREGPMPDWEKLFPGK